MRIIAYVTINPIKFATECGLIKRFYLFLLRRDVILKLIKYYIIRRGIISSNSENRASNTKSIYNLKQLLAEVGAIVDWLYKLKYIKKR